MTFLAQITQGDNHLRRYTPRSDFLFSLDTCPRINIEIFSNPNESDRYRGLLQAGLLVRVVNMLNQKLDKPSFVAIMVYITEDFTAERYLVYQPELNDETVGIPNFFYCRPQQLITFTDYIYHGCYVQPQESPGEIPVLLPAL